MTSWSLDGVVVLFAVVYFGARMPSLVVGVVTYANRRHASPAHESSWDSLLSFSLTPSDRIGRP
jgi:hypothetical protein